MHHWIVHLSLSFSEKMISSEVLEGVPLLVLANKQDVEVSTYLHTNTLKQKRLQLVYEGHSTNSVYLIELNYHVLIQFSL